MLVQPKIVTYSADWMKDLREKWPVSNPSNVDFHRHLDEFIRLEDGSYRSPFYEMHTTLPGVIVGDLNFDHEIARDKEGGNRAKFDLNYPEFPEHNAGIYDYTDGPQIAADGESSKQPTERRKYLNSYGVCDSPEQLLELFPIIDALENRYFCIAMTQMLRSEQAPEGGWRWHKWGGYVGVHEPQNEYLYDEIPQYRSDGKSIDEVWVFHIYELRESEMERPLIVERQLWSARQFALNVAQSQ